MSRSRRALRWLSQGLGLRGFRGLRGLWVLGFWGFGFRGLGSMRALQVV